MKSLALKIFIAAVVLALVFSDADLRDRLIGPALNGAVLFGIIGLFAAATAPLRRRRRQKLADDAEKQRRDLGY